MKRREMIKYEIETWDPFQSRVPLFIFISRIAWCALKMVHIFSTDRSNNSHESFVPDFQVVSSLVWVG